MLIFKMHSCFFQIVTPRSLIERWQALTVLQNYPLADPWALFIENTLIASNLKIVEISSCFGGIV